MKGFDHLCHSLKHSAWLFRMFFKIDFYLERTGRICLGYYLRWHIKSLEKPTNQKKQPKQHDTLKPGFFRLFAEYVHFRTVSRVFRLGQGDLAQSDP
jgi:hypothetical protein